MTSPAHALFGDVTNDGNVFTNDIICTARIVVELGLDGTSCVAPEMADMNCNGTVTTTDIVLIAQQAAGLPLSASVDTNANGIVDACEPDRPAFPGAQGYGATSVGGRGGDVLIVDSLDDNALNPTPGSLRWALGQSGPRTLVFRVSGTILLQDRLNIVQPFVTIAGQSAPAPGITIGMDPDSNLGTSTLLQIRTHDVIVRHLRLRRGTAEGVGDSLGLYDGAERVMVDHVSATWGTDENIDISARSEDAIVRKISIQNSLVAEGMWDTKKSTSPASKGFLISGTNKTEYWRQVQDVSIHHNLMAHNTHRNPRVAAKGAQIVNNVMYNWFTRVGSTFKDVRVDWEANRFQAGPMSTQFHVLFHATTDSNKELFYNQQNGYPPPSIYIEGNRVPGYTGEDSTLLEANNWLMLHDHYLGGPIDTSFRRMEPLSPGTFPVHVVAADDTMWHHRMATVGANAVVGCDGRHSLVRDSIDARIVDDVLQGTGISKTNQIITSAAQGGGYPAQTTVWPCTDKDADGLPFLWEEQQGLQDDDPSDAQVDGDGDGFTNLEEYLNGTDPLSADTNDTLHTITLGDQSLGTVWLMPAPHPVRCGDTCREWKVHHGQMMTVRAVPINGSNEATWNSGPCDGQTVDICHFTVTADTNLDATTDAPPTYYELHWKIDPVSTGTGSVIAINNPLSCGAQCIAVPEGESVEVEAIGDTGSAFHKWTFGKCAKAPNNPNTAECTIDPMPPAAQIKAQFVLK